MQSDRKGETPHKHLSNLFKRVPNATVALASTELRFHQLADACQQHPDQVLAVVEQHKDLVEDAEAETLFLWNTKLRGRA